MAALYADVQHLEQLVRAFAQAFGPSGHEDPIRALIRRYVEPLADQVSVDALGNLIAFVRGRGGPGARRVMLAAHMDEIGLMVTHIDDKGFLRFAPIGGHGPATLVGQRVVFADGTAGVIGVEKLDDVKDLKLDRLFIDIGAEDRAAAEGRVQVGSAAVFAREVTAAGSRLTGKALDDRSGCAVLVEVMRHLRAESVPHDVYCVFSVQEEVGLRGARTAAYAIAPDLALAVDVTASGDTPKGETLNMQLGKGTAIKVKDNSLIAHPWVRQLLVDAARAHGIPYQMEVLPYGGTDAGAIHLTRSGVPAGALSIPTRYLHTPAEMLDLRDVAATVDLLVTVLRQPLPDPAA